MSKRRNPSCTPTVRPNSQTNNCNMELNSHRPNENKGFVCDDYTYSAVLKACAETRSGIIGRSVHCHVLKGVVYPSVVVCNAVLSMYASCMDSGVKRISWCVKAGRFEEGVGCFVKMMRSGVKASVVSFVNVFGGVAAMGDVRIGEVVYGLLVKSGEEYCGDVFAMSSAISMFSELGSVEYARMVFESSLVRNIEKGMNDESLMLVYDMQKHGFMIDDVTVTALLSAASNLRNKKIGKQTHGYLLRHNIYFEGIESYLIDMYAKSGLIKVAQNIFDRNCSNDRDQATWNTMIAGNCQSGLIEQAFGVFRQMLDHSIPPNAVTVASILPGCSIVGMDTYSKLGMIAYAENVFSLSPEKNAVTYTNMILGYGQHGMCEKSLDLFKSMKESGVQPDSVTIVAVLSACSYSGFVNEGLQIFESMEDEYNIVPSLEHYCCVVDMLGRVGRVSEAYDFVNGLGEKGNHYRLWGSLLGCCRTHGEFQLGKVVANKLVEMGVGNKTSGYHVLLSNMYAEEGNWEFVDRLRKEMYEKGMLKEIGYSWIDNGGRTDYFMSRDKNHSTGDEISHMLDVLDSDMKDPDSTVTTHPTLIEE
ncbi:hypothetical protein CTI12_AA189140 [Artemisia annua]|uniref:Pentatricopeptide repeat-containing protein n=1 Tax=Artemisia annua TaxID=35608 RepID=A0A2U1P5Y8_ARTAN|nr:hypothetical protein CTI12_AA189140 [Artemisia annua]